MSRLTVEHMAVGVGLAIAGASTIALVIRATHHRAPPHAIAESDSGGDPVCAKAREDARQVVYRARRDDADCDLRLYTCEDSVFCAGPWILGCDQAQWAGGAPPCGDLGIVFSLVHVDTQGRRVRMVPGLTDGMLQDDGHVLLVNAGDLETSTLTVGVPLAFDFDGDGDAEVVVASDGEAGGVTRASRVMYTFRSGAIAPYPPAAGIVFERADDIDDDGRPDLLGAGPYAVVHSNAVYSDEPPVAPPIFAAHSRSDGTFSSTDGASRAFTLSECPIRPDLDFDGATWSPTEARMILCARLWGTSQAEVGRSLAAVCPRFGDADEDPEACPGWTKRLAAIEPPFALP